MPFCCLFSDSKVLGVIRSHCYGDDVWGNTVVEEKNPHLRLTNDTDKLR
jgi:hypothetical protein